jgi:hypothetical protein
MEWLVVIDDEGVQAQYLMGKSTEKAAQEEVGLKKHARIVFAFENKIDPEGRTPDNMEWREWREIQENWKEFVRKRVGDIHAKWGASPAPMKHGYDIRKTTLKNYIEVLAELDAKDYDQFHKNYQGLDGAIEILASTIKLMSPHVATAEEAGEKVMKWMTKLRNEQDLNA